MGVRTIVLIGGVLLALAAAPMAHAAAAVPAPADAWLAGATSSTATLRWTKVSGATGYEVRQGTKRITRVKGSTSGVSIRGLRPASFQQYSIVALRGARRSAPTDAVPVVTRAATTCTHYVSSNGSNAGRGTAASPWRTISRLTDAWQPGTVGCVAGSFVEDVSIRRGGTGAAKVTLRAWPGYGASLRGRLWIARGADHVVVQGLHLDGRAIDDTLRKSLPSPTINGNGAMLLGNDITNAGTRVCVVLGSVRGYGTAVETTLAYNRIHDCGTRGSNTHHGIYVEGSLRARIVHNVIWRNADRGIQLYPSAQKSLVYGNLIHGNGQGIIFSGAEGWSSDNNRVLRNVISGSVLRSNIEHYWEAPSRPGRGNVAVRNCLGGAAQGNVALPAVGYVVRGNTSGTLRFRNAGSGDLRLLTSSGCRSFLRSATLPLVRIAG